MGASPIETGRPTRKGGPRKRLEKSVRRAQLLSIGAQLFDARGYTGVGMMDVAEAAGISHGLLYHYFPSKEAFFVATLENSLGDLFGTAVIDRSMPLPEAARRSIQNFIDYVQNHARVFVSIFAGAAAELPEVRQTCAAARKRFVGHVLGPVEQAHERSLPNTRFALTAYFGMAERALVEWLEDPSQTSRPRLEELLLSGFGAAVTCGLQQDLPEAEALLTDTRAAFQAG